MKNKPAHIIHRYTKDITVYANKIGVSFSGRYIHDLRTTFKKIRAILRWQKKPPGVCRSLKEIYQAAGELRNLQVAGKILKKKKGLPAAFFAWMNQLMVKAEREWKKINTEKTLGRFRKKIARLDIKPLNNKSFFNKNLTCAGATMYPDPVLDSALHTVRKRIKDVQYVLGTIKKKSALKTYTKNIRAAYLKKAAGRIGNYNDKRIALLLLTTYANQETIQSRISKTNAVIDRLFHSKATEKAKLIAELRKKEWLFFKPAPAKSTLR